VKTRKPTAKGSSRTYAAVSAKWGVPEQTWANWTAQQRWEHCSKLQKEQRLDQVNKWGWTKRTWRTLTPHQKKDITCPRKDGKRRVPRTEVQWFLPQNQTRPQTGDPGHEEWRLYAGHGWSASNRHNWQDGTPIKFLLTFEEWLNFWVGSGHWEQRGRKKGQYVMSRKNDYGNYELGNIEIVSVEDNHAERGRTFFDTGEAGKRIHAAACKKNEKLLRAQAKQARMSYENYIKLSGPDRVRVLRARQLKVDPKRWLAITTREREALSQLARRHPRKKLLEALREKFTNREKLGKIAT
jgi:hypothetical protein